MLRVGYWYFMAGTGIIRAYASRVNSTRKVGLERDEYQHWGVALAIVFSCGILTIMWVGLG